MFTLNKNPDRDFVILNITDTHITGRDWTEDTGHKAILDKTLAELIERVRPDLITLTGDYSTEPYFIDMVRFADYMESFGIPWAPVWGNHDHGEGDVFLDHAADVFLTKPHCIFEKGDRAMGSGNYIIRIEENGKPVTALFMTDTHGGYISDAQTAWLSENAALLKREGCPNAAVLMHMPMTEYNDALDAALVVGIGAASSVSMEESYREDCWNEGYRDSFGIKRENVCPVAPNPAWFEALRASDLVKYVICGHEHINNFAVTYRGIRLIYSLKTDLAAYGSMPFNGGSVITVNTDGISSVHHEYVDVTGMVHNP